jgi:hypothetical protein
MEKLRHPSNKWLLGTILGAAILFYSCEKNDKFHDPYVLPDFKNPQVSILKDNLDCPSGLSGFLIDNKSNKASKSIHQNLTSGVFVEGPSFIDYHDDVGPQLTKNPRISRFEIDLDQIPSEITPIDYLKLSIISEIDFSIYSNDFDSFNYIGCWISLGKPDSVWRAARLVLDNCVVNDGSILTSSNSSDKIFITDFNGETEIFLEDPKLLGITDLVYNKSGEIYAAQAPIIDQTDPLKVLRTKRIISIEKGSIKTEFELPTAIAQRLNQEISYRWKHLPNIEQIKIIENSDAGKDRFGVDYYVADMLSNVIYKVDNDGNIAVLAKNLNYPTSIAIDSVGNLFYTGSPITSKWKPEFNRRESLYAVNPESGSIKLICEYGPNVEEYPWPATDFLEIDNLIYLVADLNVTNLLYETSKALFFLITNTRLGNIHLIKIDK